MKETPNTSAGKWSISRMTKWGFISALTGVFITGLVTGLLLRSGGGSGETTAPIGSSLRHDIKQPMFWTCSMHPNIQKQGQGKCPICGMDLIPVASEDKKTESVRQIVISDAARALLNVQTVPVERRHVTAEVRMVGKVDYDETRLGHITAWIPGRLDRLYVDYTGVQVNKGDHMVYIYSPELYSAQDELIQVLRRSKAQNGNASIFADVTNLIEPTRERLRLWGMTTEQIREIEESEKPSDHLTVYSPMSGIVIKKNLQEGDYVKTGDRIYTVADLSHVWVTMDAYESDLVWLRYGQEATFTTETYPGEKFVGKIAFIDPVLNDKTRTVKVRVNVVNIAGKLKPEMFVRGIVRTQISTGGRVIEPHLAGKWISPMHPEIVKDTPGECDVCGMPLVKAESLGYVTADFSEESKPLVIPVTAALVTGTRAIVYVEVPDADKPTFEGREVVLGPRAGDYYLVRNGLKEGDIVVTNGNFKIDSAVQLMAKPSMMTPEGGGNRRYPDGADNDIPEKFRSHLQRLESAYKAIAKAVKLKDVGIFHDKINIFGKALNKIDATPLNEHPRMQWNELTMLLDNDVVDGLSTKKVTGIERVFNGLTRNMRRIRDRFGSRHDIPVPQPPQSLGASAEFQPRLIKLWEAYISLQHALSDDDLSLGQQAVKQLQTSLSAANVEPSAEAVHNTWVSGHTNLIQILQGMGQSGDLESIRKNFSLLSDEFLVLIDAVGHTGLGAVYRLHCPMVFDGEGAMWLQEDKHVRNPYFGQSMRKCTDDVKLLSDLYAPDTHTHTDKKVDEYKERRHHE